MLKFQLSDNGVIEGLTKLGENVNPAAKRGIKQFLARLRHKLRSESGYRITYPVQWDSAKQRKAFFASDGFGAGIPTSRSGAYQKGYEYVETDKGYSFSNVNPWAVYVGGDAYGRGQSKIHQGRWLLMRDAFADEIDKLPDDVNVEIENEIEQDGLGD